MATTRTDELLAFIARAADDPDVPALIEEFRRVIRLFGFDCSSGGNWVGLGKHRHYRFFFNDWPQDWLDYYTEHGFFQRDFIVAESRRRMAPFTWAEMDPSIFASPVAQEFFAASRAHGWMDGFAVPIRGAGGYEGIVSLAAKQTVELGAVERGLLETAARVLNERCRTTVGLGDTPQPLPQLTDREIECLQWVSLGKTDWEIGELLGVTKATAHFHIEQAKRKLGVTSRVQAVALLLLHGVL
ncbi:MAG TPA: LuxR family transcriptional regulator [Bauldia sp.]|nr:LuxR family transcriptional regulator [Bauldia sp.]